MILGCLRTIINFHESDQTGKSAIDNHEEFEQVQTE